MQTSSGSMQSKNRIETGDLNSSIAMSPLDFLAFITFVINSLEKETTHSNRIRLVVEAARQCLGIHAISPEMIHSRLAV